MVPFWKNSRIQQQKKYHFENQNMVPFEQSAKNMKQKWYHLRKVRKKVPIEKFAKIRQH